MTGKLEGLEFLYRVMERMGWDNIPAADLELVMATVKEMETPRKR